MEKEFGLMEAKVAKSLVPKFLTHESQMLHK